MELMISGNVLDRVKQTKFLGFIIDEQLNWSDHIISFKSKVASSLYAINAAKTCVTKRCLLMLYNSLILPYLSYGILLWGSTSMSTLSPLCAMQKKAVRIITHSKRNTNTDQLFASTKLLKLNDIYNFYLGMHMYCQINKLLPISIISNIARNEDVHHYETRNRDLIHYTHRRTAQVSKTYHHTGPQFWNSLPKDIQNNQNLKSFKRNLKTFLISILDWNLNKCKEV